MTIRINRINVISDIQNWHLLESTIPDAKNWLQLSLKNPDNILRLNPGIYSIVLTLDTIPELSQIDFLIGTNNPAQKYYRFYSDPNGIFKSEPMQFTVPAELKFYIYYKITKIPHIDNNYNDQQDLLNNSAIPFSKKIPHIASEIIHGDLFVLQ